MKLSIDLGPCNDQWEYKHPWKGIQIFTSQCLELFIIIEDRVLRVFQMAKSTNLSKTAFEVKSL